MHTTRIACTVGLAGALALAATACSGEDGPAGFCGAIGRDVEGLDSITSEDGSSVVGTWVHVFVEGVTEADASSREQIAEAVRSDADGFEQVQDAADGDLRPALDRLYELVQDPEAAQSGSSDPEVQSDVAVISERTGSGGCDFLR